MRTLTTIFTGIPRTYLQGTVEEDHTEPAVNAAVGVYHSFVAGGKRSAFNLQTAQVLHVPAIEHARAPSEEATCEERGQEEGEEQQVVSIRENGSR
jgi:hypothetical protein